MKLSCRVGLHSWFRQWDRWGNAEVCRYCLATRKSQDSEATR